MKIKVVQCWDDGTANDARLTQLLRKYNVKATFNLCPGAMPDDKGEPLRPATPDYNNYTFKNFIPGKIAVSEMAEIYDGFELASHCWFHEVAGKCPDEVFFKAAYDARRFLEDMYQREFRGFAYPCSGVTSGAKEMLRNAGFAYARIVGKTDNVYACTDTMEFSPSCKFNDPEFYEIFEKAKKSGAFYFWGHSYEMINDEQLWNDFEEKIATLSADPDVEWVNVVDIADEINAKN